MGNHESKGDSKIALGAFSGVEGEQLKAILQKISSLQTQQDKTDAAKGDGSEATHAAIDAYASAYFSASLSYATAQFFLETANALADQRTKGVKRGKVNLQVFGVAVSSLVQGSSAAKAAIVKHYVTHATSTNAGATTHATAFVRDLASAALGFYEASAGKKAFKSWTVSDRLITFLMRNESAAETAAGLDFLRDAETEEASSLKSITKALSQNAYLAKLFETAFTHLFLDPLGLIVDHAQTHHREETRILALRHKNMKRPRLAGIKSRLLNIEDYWCLDTTLSAEFRNLSWHGVYDGNSKGRSWTNFMNSITDRGSTVLIIKDADGHVFGGFAPVVSSTTRLHSFFGHCPFFFFFPLTPSLFFFPMKFRNGSCIQNSLVIQDRSYLHCHQKLSSLCPLATTYVYHLFKQTIL